MLFALREITPDRAWDEKNLNFSFWWINSGLVVMLVFGLIPKGFYQLMQSINHGTWYARSAEVISHRLVVNLDLFPRVAEFLGI